MDLVLRGRDVRPTLDLRTRARAPCRVRIVPWRPPDTGNTKSKERPCRQAIQTAARSVHIDGRRINACLCLAVMHDGDQITTIEGLGTPEKLHPMQAAFLGSDAYQCGYCTPGQIMSATALMKEACGPTDAAVKEAMSGNICRCGAYVNILEAIQTVRKAG